MKTGIIVYITGGNDESMYGAEDMSGLIDRLALNADSVEVVASHLGQFDISDAWYALTIRGMHRIICKMAEFTNLGEIKLTGRELRLCG